MDRFDAATVFTGTGARLTQQGVLFTTATNQVDRVYSMCVDDSLWISNSMVFVLVEAGDGPDPNYPHYHGDMLSHFQAGLLREIKTLPTRLGNRVRLHEYRNVLVQPDLSIRYGNKTIPEAPRDFEGYKDLLLGSMNKVFENASDPARRVRYRPLTTVSTGLDSPAVSALARQCGCTEAFTFATLGGNPSDDDGSRIADALGMKCVGGDLLDYRKLPGFPEAEFCACSPPGYQVTWRAMEPLLESRVLLTGMGGAMFWERQRAYYPGLAHDWSVFIGGDSVTEFRLRVGFQCFHISYMGAGFNETLRRIAESKEMKPWSIGTEHYNKPVPRRIAEESGVPRELFGVRKIARGHVWLNKKGMLSDASERDFRAFCERSVRRPTRLRRGFWVLMYRAFNVHAWLKDRLCPYLSGRLLTFLIPPIALARYGCLPKQHPFFLQWGFERIRSRYEPGTGCKDATSGSCPPGP